jgi:DNA-binding transcriptional LysR family regulator
MDLPAIQCFVKVVQTGSFTRAAEALQTQKAHVSRVVSQLEAELGVRLLERSTRALSLTEVGREFFERAVGILASVDEAHRVVQKSQGVPRGTLKLTCGVEFGMIAVSGWINGYLAQYPDVQVDADFTARVVDIVHEGFDLAIRLGPLADSNLAARKIGELQYGLFASPGYLSRHALPTHPDALSKHALLAFFGGRNQGAWSLRQANHCVRVELQPRLRANNVFSIRDAARQGLGIAQLPWVIGQECVDQGALQPVLPGWAPEPVAVQAVFASARYLTPKVRAFIDLAVSAMAPHSLLD